LFINEAAAVMKARENFVTAFVHQLNACLASAHISESWLDRWGSSLNSFKAKPTLA